ncbi:molecular chaperone [Pantoea sp. BAV 3049]|uniref:fimbrial biogenesis chaperone n=1 Tax=Pantoea sp. BAV 3049 TaxID=2654188 RepID=UPI00131ECF63|nr:molecular chaperone [Pantoea sp. BAV 3049]
MRIPALFLAICSLLLPVVASAGGVGLGTTRLVYHAGDKQASLDIRNTHTTSPFLIQTWLDNSAGTKTQDFVVVPPLSVLRPNNENTLRVIFTGKGLPADRETLYWMTVKAIPQSESQGNNTLQLAAASRIKVFYRPAGLTEKVTEAHKKITGSLNKGQLTLKNPTPYYLTLITLRVDGKEIKPLMLPPKGSAVVPGTFNGAKNFSYQTINDYGAWTTLLSKKLD